MAQLTMEQTLDMQARAIKQLQEQLAKVQSGLPPSGEDEGTPAKPKEWPKLVWKKCKLNPAQIDHPGQKYLIVDNQDELEAALRDGWRREAFGNEYPQKPSDDIEEDKAPDPPVLQKKGYMRA